MFRVGLEKWCFWVTIQTHGRLESICFKNENMPRTAGLVEDLFLLQPFSKLTRKLFVSDIASSYLLTVPARLSSRLSFPPGIISQTCEKLYAVLDKTKRKKFFATSVMCLYSQAPCKRRYYYFWPTTPNLFVYYMLRPFAHPAAICCVLLGVVAQSLKPVKLLNAKTNSQHVFCSVIAEAKRKNVGSVLHSSSCLVGATHAHHTWSTWILQSLMGCILPTMHWSVQHCCK